MNVRLLHVASIGVVTVFCLLGCLNKKQALSLPSNWPIPQLTLPPRAVLVFPAKVDEDPLPKGYCRRISKASFIPSSSWGPVVSHVEKCLAQLGYVEHVVVHPGGHTTQDEYRCYWAADERTFVEMLLSGHEGKLMVKLMITQFDQPQNIIDTHGQVHGSGSRVEIRPLQGPGAARQ